MLFSHPSMARHKEAGMRKALASSKTPAHLKPHIAKRLAKGASLVKQQVDPDAYNELQEAATTGQDDPQDIDDLQTNRPKVRSVQPIKKVKKRLKQTPVRRPGSINNEMFFGRG